MHDAKDVPNCGWLGATDGHPGFWHLLHERTRRIQRSTIQFKAKRQQPDALDLRLSDGGDTALDMRAAVL